MAETDETSLTLPADLAPTAAAATVEALARALELHDYRRGEFGETAAHTSRVTRLAVALAERAAPELLLDPQLVHGFRLHDIGMIGVSSWTLLKPGALTPAELDEIREHPWLGERIVAPVPALNGLAREVIACHHERWNGTGYPRGLRGVEIPQAARIFAIVDAFDAITHDQPYRSALSAEAACEEIHAKAGSDFDPELAHLFLELEELREPAEAAPSAAGPQAGVVDPSAEAEVVAAMDTMEPPDAVPAPDPS